MFNKALFKKVACLIIIILLTVSMCACADSEKAESTAASVTEAPLPKIGILSLTPDENTQNAINGFKQALSSTGYTVNESCEFIISFCDSDKELDKAADNMVKESPELIYAIGVQAARAAKESTEEIPVVFSCVNDPLEENLLKSCESPEANVTGVCDYSPVFEQIELILKLYPDVNRIGCLYNGGDEEAVFSANLAAGEAQNLGVKHTLYPSLTESEFEDNLDTALEKCDALYLTDDALVKSEIEIVIKSAKKRSVPVFAESSELVEKGCLASCITDYEQIGYSAGELGVILIRELKAVSDVPVEYASECTVVINSQTQKSLKLSLPDEIKESAVFVKTA